MTINPFFNLFFKHHPDGAPVDFIEDDVVQLRRQPRITIQSPPLSPNTSTSGNTFEPSCKKMQLLSRPMGSMYINHQYAHDPCFERIIRSFGSLLQSAQAHVEVYEDFTAYQEDYGHYIEGLQMVKGFGDREECGEESLDCMC
jgi:hypothetical protein